MKNPFPDFINELPAKDYGLEGLYVHADTSPLGETFFVYAEKEIPFPEHAHGAQYTVVISGKCDFTSEGKTVTYSKGDIYLIRDGQRHQITLHPGYAEFNYVLNKKDADSKLEDEKMRKLDDDIEKGFAAESQGIMFSAFAEKADMDGMDHIARLFRAVAESDKIQALIHYKLMNKMGDTQENLKCALDATRRCFATFYPDMINDAEAAGKTDIAQCFRAIDKAKEGQAQIFDRALKDPFSIKEDTDYYVCTVCGFLSEGPCDKCPACGSGADKFKKVD